MPSSPIASDQWQVAEARHCFGDLLDAATDGRSQTIRHRDGREFVLVSRETFEALRRDLRTVLTAFDFGLEEDEFDRAIAELRPASPEDPHKGGPTDVPRHQRRQRRAKTTPIS